MSTSAFSVAERAGRFVERPDISARSVLVTVWGDTIAPLTESAWLSELFALLDPLPYNERLLRTSLSRLQNDGWVSAQRDGRRSRYELTDSAAAQTRAAEDRIYGERPATCDGRWELVITDEAVSSDTLRAAGYATLGANLFGRPVTESSPLPDAARAELFPAAETAVATATFESSPPLRGEARVIDAFALDAVASDYERFVADYGGVDPTDAADLEPADAFALRTMMTHEYRRIRLRDPLVPLDLLGADWVGDQARNVIADLYQAVLSASSRWAAKTLGTPDPPKGSPVTTRLVTASE